ncbi:MAG: TolC family protein, partial [Gemmatimonadaceae bacterium]|nr:TolC family protein [Gemmatimonadaceae bacterium]
MPFTKSRTPLSWVSGTALLLSGCVAPRIATEVATAPSVPGAFRTARDSVSPAVAAGDTTTAADMPYATFFDDARLRALIDTAVRNNPEVLATLQEVEMSRNELRGIRGRLLPKVGVGAGAGIEKVGLYTSQGAGDASAEITPGEKVPERLGDLMLGFNASWEVDVRGKIRNQKGAALNRYLGSVEGSRFVRTALVAEVANTYYELSALDAKLAIIRQTIDLQRRELEVVRAQREAAAVTELAVKQFEALLLNAQAMEYEVLQQIREAENRLNRLLGRFPQPVERGALAASGGAQVLRLGLPLQLLRNRPDIRQAETEVAASKFDLRAARAEFFPELNLGAGLGARAFAAKYLFKFPESMMYGLVSEVAAPLLNRTAQQAEFGRASAYQRKALIEYRRAILAGVSEVSDVASAIGNLEQEY